MYVRAIWRSTAGSGQSGSTEAMLRPESGYWVSSLSGWHSSLHLSQDRDRRTGGTMAAGFKGFPAVMHSNYLSSFFSARPCPVREALRPEVSHFVEPKPEHVLELTDISQGIRGELFMGNNQGQRFCAKDTNRDRSYYTFPINCKTF